jgi:hypothetical protein
MVCRSKNDKKPFGPGGRYTYSVRSVKFNAYPTQFRVSHCVWVLVRVRVLVLVLLLSTCAGTGTGTGVSAGAGACVDASTGASVTRECRAMLFSVIRPLYHPLLFAGCPFCWE